MQLPELIPSFILASASPRRKALLEEIGLRFEVVKVDVDETENYELEPLEIVDDLALRKQEACRELRNQKLVITADTLVFIENEVLAKPANKAEAREMLKKLSGNTHSVTTSVCLGYQDKLRQFNVTTQVHIRDLPENIINHYIEKYQPYDKAGSYGIQEMLGHVGIDKINGSYTNVVGLPVAETFEAITAVTEQWNITN